MEGIPAPDVADYKRRKEIELGLNPGSITQPPAKRPKVENRILSEAELKAQLEAHKALMGASEQAPVAPVDPATSGAVVNAAPQTYSAAPSGMPLPPPGSMVPPFPGPNGPSPPIPGPPPGALPFGMPPFPGAPPGFPPGLVSSHFFCLNTLRGSTKFENSQASSPRFPGHAASWDAAPRNANAAIPAKRHASPRTSWDASVHATSDGPASCIHSSWRRRFATFPTWRPSRNVDVTASRVVNPADAATWAREPSGSGARTPSASVACKAL